MKKYQVTFLGAGPGGYSAAVILAEKGYKVAVIEKKYLGGTCVNEGCIPTKTLLKSAKVYEQLNKCSLYGLSNQNLSFDFKLIQNRRINNKTKLNGAIQGALEAANVDVYFEEGTVLDKNTIELKDKTVISTEKIVLATGSRNRELNLPGFAEGVKNNKIVYSTDLLFSESFPKSLTIVGAGPISLEFAYFFSTLGSKVTILETSEKVMSSLDKEFSNHLENYISSKNINLITKAQVKKFKDDKLFFTIDNKERTISSDKILVAVGRVANTENFDKLNLEKNPNGSIKVNSNMQTSLENVYAIGDVTGAKMLSTTAYKQGDVAVQSILEREVESFDARLIPWAIYINPEIAGVGYTEQEAEAEFKDNYVAVTIPAMQLPRNHADDLLEHGFFKIIVQKDNGKILGSAIFLENASLLINEIALAITNNLTVWDIEKTGHTHPTLSEAIYYATRALSYKLK